MERYEVTPNMSQRRVRLKIRRIVLTFTGVSLALMLAVTEPGCGLGYVELVPEEYVEFRIENGTPGAAEVNITVGSMTQDLPVAADFEKSSSETAIRVPSGNISVGSLQCDEIITVTAAAAETSSTAIELAGEGTGTLGFDSGSVGTSGERFLLRNTHFSCGDTILIQLTSSQGGQLAVVAEGSPLPDPITGSDESEATDAAAPATAAVTLVVVNEVESTVQVNFATGNGSLAASGGTSTTSQFDVRVPPGATTTGSGVCAQEYMIAGAHLETTGTTFAEGSGDIFQSGGNVNFHGIVFTGDGTGTEGFDSSSIAVARGRLLRLGNHFECGAVITITVTATNNQVKLDDEGQAVTGEYGDPEVKYGVGEGTITVRNP